MRLPISTLNRSVVTCGLTLYLLCGLSAAGQTERQLAARFRKVVIFEIRPGIDAYPMFAKDGVVCQLVIQKRALIDLRGSDIADTIPPAMAKQLVDEVVPSRDRGKPSKYLSPQSYIAGGSSFIKHDYEHVSVATYGVSVDGRVSGARAIVITWPNRTCAPTREQ